ncbi:MAG: efflux RND transporter periplasmic adaptor subunit [Gammaproteobacteria bacterium]|nr:efflux RND transporter periplasmic adaptor subunit [Gammaproteobacteria bacterium]
MSTSIRCVAPSRLASLPVSTSGFQRRALLWPWLIFATSLFAPAAAHEGQDHADEAAPKVASTAAIAGLPARDVAELTSELYEALIESHGDHLDIWLDRYDSNEPVRGAKLGVAIGEGAEIAAREESPGQYSVDIEPIAPGSSAPITLTIQAAPGEDLLGGTLEIAAPAATDLSTRFGGWLAALWRWALGLAVLAGIAVVVLRRRRSGTPVAGVAAAAIAAPLAGAVLLVAALAGGAPAVAHEGHDHEEESAPAGAAGVGQGPGAATAVAGGGERPIRLADGSVFVPKPTQRILELRTQIATEGPTPVSLRLAGEIAGDPRASAALQTLQGGRVAGNAGQWPVLGATVRRGQVLLRLTPSGSGGERASTAAEAARVAAELSQAQAELARLEGLAGVVSRAEVENARVRVASLRAQRAAFGAPLAAGGGEAIVAPIDGLIASIDARPGAVFAPGETLLTVIDPSRLSIEALAFEPVTAAAVTRASVALRDGTTLEARLVGVGAQLKGGAVPVRLDLAKVAPGLMVGQPVTVLLERSITAPGMPLPVEALVRLSSGERIVYEKVSAERFMPRTVRVRQVSADRVAVLAGLEPAARVVVVGAPLIAQIR